MQPADEKRSHPRCKAEYPIQILLPSSSDEGDIVVPGRTTDISTSGLGLTLDSPVRHPSTTLRLRLDAGHPLPALELPGHIVWSAASDHGATSQCGIRFAPLSSDQCSAWDSLLSRHDPGPRPLRREDLIPRTALQTERGDLTRAWLSQRLGVDLEHVATFSFDARTANKNIENLIGACQVPLGITGPLLVNGTDARGLFYVPFATTEGTLVETYQAGMMAISRAGGATVHVLNDRVDITSAFILEDLSHAIRFARWLGENFDRIKAAAEQTTRHGELVDLKAQVLGRRVLASFAYTTGDAMGLNIITIATERACAFIMEQYPAQKYFLRCNASADKKPSSLSLHRCYGKEVVADATIPRRVLRRYFGVTPEEVNEFCYTGTMGSIQAGIIGLNAHFANGLAAIYLACGQDIAQVVNSAIGIATAEVTSLGDLYMSVKLPSLIVATVGGGTQLATQGECLRIMDCYGQGKARKFSEIIAASLLAGELAICAALASGRFVQAHMRKRMAARA
ncbi:MAG TPA: PilZ domain-containing protein [Anaeromyxobacter sp.]|nr:PilZ domain-containing protein [Anaeromyxobacter sp.]